MGEYVDSALNAISSVQPIYSMAGFAVGTLIGLTGVGGGSLMTPLLILLFGLHPSTAVGTDLLFAATTKTAGTLVHGINHTIDWRLVRRLATGSAPAQGISMSCLSYIDITSPLATQIVTTVLAVALLFTAVLLVSRRWIVKPLCLSRRQFDEKLCRLSYDCGGRDFGDLGFNLVRGSRGNRHDSTRHALPATFDSEARWI